jgi:hypothetical protein
MSVDRLTAEDALVLGPDGIEVAGDPDPVTAEHPRRRCR